MAYQGDNKSITGAIDRVFVSKTEYYEVSHFVDHYLQHRNADITEANRKIVRDNINQYTGRAPVQRTELTAFLDGRLTVNR